jgi:CubicO group peptidase (beta-lactamase class C family)
MANTHFHDDPQHVQKNRAVGYLRSEEGSYRIAVLGNFDKVGDGGLYSTVEDLYHWDQNFYRDRLGGKGFADQLLTRGVLSTGDTLDYAFALVHGDYKGLPTVEHGGSYQGYRTNLLRFPRQRFSVILLCNESTIDPGSLARQVADLYLIDAFGESLAAYAGSYYSDELDTTYRLVVRAGDLVVQRPGASDTRLVPEDDDGFRLKSYHIRFLRDAQGRVHAFALDAGRARDIRFAKIPQSGE